MTTFVNWNDADGDPAFKGLNFRETVLTIKRQYVKELSKLNLFDNWSYLITDDRLHLRFKDFNDGALLRETVEKIMKKNETKKRIGKTSAGNIATLIGAL